MNIQMVHGEKQFNGDIFVTKTHVEFLEELKIWLKEKSQESGSYNEDWFIGKELAFDEVIEKIEKFESELKENKE